jgi:preprotein translocase subunit SecG
MVQNPKGGGLSSSFGGGGTQSLGGVQSTTNFLDKSTWTLAIALFALILLSNFSIPRNNVIDLKSATEDIVNERETFDDAPATLDTSLENDSTN